MKRRDSAIQWLEVNLMKFANECEADVGNTTVHRTANHILNGLIHRYFDVLEDSHKEWGEAHLSDELVEG